MAYQKKTWKDRLVEYATRRVLTDSGSGDTQIVEVARSEGTVYQEGDAFSADNMNDLEDRIEAEINMLEDSITYTDVVIGSTTSPAVSDRKDATQVGSAILDYIANNLSNSALSKRFRFKVYDSTSAYNWNTEVYQVYDNLIIATMFDTTSSDSATMYRLRRYGGVDTVIPFS